MRDADWIEARESGVRLFLKVHPKAKRERIAGVHDGRVKVDVTAAPERGAANRAVEALLASILDVPEREVQVVAGATSRLKTVDIDGLDRATAASRIELAIRS